MTKKAGVICRGSIPKATPVYEDQARFLARLIRDLTEGHHHLVRSAKEGERLRPFFDLPAYQLFIQGAYACGFVCKDLGNEFSYKDALHKPQATVAVWNFLELRHYTHSLLRAERWADGYSSPVLDALEAGVLDALADRLMDDETLYAPY